jgi:uncharacterized protein YjbI with pentapeptide repeats
LLIFLTNTKKGGVLMEETREKTRNRLLDLGVDEAKLPKIGRPNLCGIVLTNCDLTNMNLAEVELVQADLSGSDLTGANLCGAKLHEAKLVGAKLCGANLETTELIGADLSMVTINDVTTWRTWLNGSNLHGATLRNCRFEEANFKGAKLVFSHMSGILFFWSNLSCVDFSDAILENTEVIECNLRKSTLSRVRLDRVDVRSSNLMDISDMDLRELSKVENIELAQLNPGYLEAIEGIRAGR